MKKYLLAVMLVLSACNSASLLQDKNTEDNPVEFGALGWVQIQTNVWKKEVGSQGAMYYGVGELGHNFFLNRYIDKLSQINVLSDADTRKNQIDFYVKAIESEKVALNFIQKQSSNRDTGTGTLTCRASASASAMTSTPGAKSSASASCVSSNSVSFDTTVYAFAESNTGSMTKLASAQGSQSVSASRSGNANCSSVSYSSTPTVAREASWSGCQSW